ncbi:MAG: hypothetical protein HY424_01405 [Candidatus Levybacteria bacterium]|nr:hypothetical protein [Candidatus Levybacteria bacterium]
MEVEKREKEIIINLTQEEIFELQRGKTIHGGRPAVTMPDAKVDVLPLRAIDPNDSLSEKDRWADDRLEKARKAPLKALLFSDGDLQIFVPAIKLTDVRVASARLSRKSIETPGTKDREGLVKHVIPQEGIRLNFGGSLRHVHIPDFFQ